MRGGARRQRRPPLTTELLCRGGLCAHTAACAPPQVHGSAYGVIPRRTAHRGTAAVMEARLRSRDASVG